MASTNNKLQFILNANLIILIILVQLQYVVSGSGQDKCIPQCSCTTVHSKFSSNCRNLSFRQIPKGPHNTDIQKLDLSENEIPQLYRDEFKEANLTNLQTLYMKNCTIQEIHPDAFVEMPILIELDLSNNLIKELHIKVFQGMPKIRKIFLNHNLLEQLRDHLFYNLTFLYAIELKNNRIHTIGLKTFHLLPVQTIQLDNNRLTILKEEMFDSLSKLKSLALAENPWNCTCELREFKDFLVSRNLYNHPTSCAYPLRLKDTLWPKMSSEDFACKPELLLSNSREEKSVVAQTENVTLSCRISGSPRPDLKWYFNNKVLKSDPRYILDTPHYEGIPKTNLDITIKNLTIVGLKLTDRGIYICNGTNSAGHAHIEYKLDVQPAIYDSSVNNSASSNILIICSIIAIVLLLILLIVITFICCACRKRRNNSKNHNNNMYTKNTSISDNGSLVTTKIDKLMNNDSMIEGGSVIIEMQKSLLTEINPVEKPPRRNDIDSSDKGDYDDAVEIKKTLLEETSFCEY